MLIDICIPFNEDVVDRRTLNKKEVVKKHIGFYDMLVKMVNSIHMNWDEQILDYRIYVFHSRPLLPEHAEHLWGVCDGVIYDQSDVDGFSDSANKIHAYKHNMLGDYSLILDVDMIFLNTPAFEFDKDVYATPASIGLKRKVVQYFFRELGSYFDNDADADPARLYRMDEPFVANGINGGCVFVRNDIKQEFGERLKEARNFIFPYLMKGGERVHMAGQLAMGVVFKWFDYGYLDKRVNYVERDDYPSIDMGDVQLLHYLGDTFKNEKVREIIDQY